jgi:hypothetical protein
MADEYFKLKAVDFLVWHKEEIKNSLLGNKEEQEKVIYALYILLKEIAKDQRYATIDACEEIFRAEKNIKKVKVALELNKIISTIQNSEIDWK